MKWIILLSLIFSMTSFAQDRSGGTGGKGGNGEADMEKIVQYFLNKNYVFLPMDCKLLTRSGERVIGKVCRGIADMISNGTSSYDHEEVYYKCCPDHYEGGVSALDL